jgi:lipoate-protein ligase A
MDNWVLNQPFRNWPAQQARPRGHRVLFRFFESQRNLVVLSSSNTAHRETYDHACRGANVPIVQRRGGGGTVVLGQGCLVLTFAFYAKELFANQRYFQIINSLWADALSSAGVSGLTTRGHSDLAFGDKKVAGTSLFRRKHLVVYQGSLLVDPDFGLISHLLQHPSREPDYRQGRSHADFLISLKQLGYTGTTQDLANLCSHYFRQHAVDRLSEDFADFTLIPEHQRVVRF